MKRVLAILAMVLMFASVCQADPFLVCAPNPGALWYVLEVDGIELPESTCEADGSLRYDMAPYAGGDHFVRAKAGNIWGWSVYSDPFNFNADLPGAPSGFGFSAE